jgi:hypothetical protein
MTAKPEQTDEELAADFMGWDWCDWLQSRRVEPAPKAVPELPKHFKWSRSLLKDFIIEHNALPEKYRGPIYLIFRFGAICRGEPELQSIETKMWLAECDRAGCSAKSVVAAMMEAGR